MLEERVQGVVAAQGLARLHHDADLVVLLAALFLDKVRHRNALLRELIAQRCLDGGRRRIKCRVGNLALQALGELGLRNS